MKFSAPLALVAGVPGIIAIALLCLVVWTTWDAQNRAETAARAANLAVVAQDLASAVQAERDETLGVLGGTDTEGLRTLAVQQAQTDAVATVFLEARAAWPAAAEDALGLALTDLARAASGIDALRETLDDRTVTADAALAAFADVRQAASAVAQAAAQLAPSPAAARDLQVLALFAHSVDLARLEPIIGQAAFQAGQWTAAREDELRTLVAEQRLLFSQAQHWADADLGDLIALSQMSPDAQRFFGLRADVLEGTARATAQGQQRWLSLGAARVAALKDAQAELSRMVEGRAASAATTARTQHVLASSMAGLLALIIVFAILRGRRRLMRALVPTSSNVTKPSRTAISVAPPAEALAASAVKPDALQEGDVTRQPRKASTVTTLPRQTPVEDPEEANWLKRFDEWLASAESAPEVFEVIQIYVNQLIPEAQGMLYVASPTHNVLTGAVGWNGVVPQDHIQPGDCWALRRGQTFVHKADEPQLGCKHDTDGLDTLAFSLCIPLTVHSDTVGLMHLRVQKTAVGQRSIDEVKRLGEVCAERIALALANILLRKQLMDQSVRDPLTGLYNRRFFADHLAFRMEQVRRNGEMLAVLAIDIDGFKAFNEKHGHDAGDATLKAIAAVLLESCGNDEIACRLGGEELALLLPGQTADDAQWRAEKLRQTIEDQIVRVGERSVTSVTVSIGIACAPEHGLTADAVLGAADDALGRAKAQGKNQIEYTRADGSNIPFVAAARLQSG